MQANKRRLDVAAGSDDKGNFTFWGKNKINMKFC